MGKIKLTESQVLMLQSLDNNKRKRIIKLTSEQYNRIFESNNFNSPSTKVSKAFKSGSRDIPDSNLKFENIDNDIDIIDFGQQVIRFLKKLLTNQNEMHLSSFWRDLNISKDDLIQRMVELNMITYGLINGNKVVKIMKNDFHTNVKTLFDELIQKNETDQLGNDLELEGLDDVKNSLSKPFKVKHKQKRSPEMIKNRLDQLRKKELKSRDNKINIGEDNYPTGSKNDPRAPWNQSDPENAIKSTTNEFNLVWWHQDLAIFEKNNQYYLFAVESVSRDEYAPYIDREETYDGRDEDGDPIVNYGDEWELDSEAIENYVNTEVSVEGHGLNDFESGSKMVSFDGDLVEEIASMIKHIKPNEGEVLKQILSNITLDETTTAASSGAFVGKLGGNTPITGIGPAKALNNILDEVGDKDINSDLNQEINGLKYKNFSHPNIGNYRIDGINHKKDSDGKLIYSLNLTKDGDKTDSELVYTFDKLKGTDKIIFIHNGEEFYDAYKLFDELYTMVFDDLKEVLKPTTIDESNNLLDTTYPDGEMVNFDNCTKLNNNKSAENGGCSVGAIDNVVKTKKTRDSVISRESIYSEVAKKTGKTISEVKKIIEKNKG